MVRLLAEEAADLGIEPAAYDPPIELVDGDTDLAADCELAVVVGGDGSILRAAEVTWGSGTPVLGVNLGHVGFLAEAEVDDVEDVIDAIVERTLDARGPAGARRPGLPRRRAGDPAPSRSTRPASRRPPASG